MTDQNKTIRYAIVGAGNIADFHAKAIQSSSNSELVAIHCRTHATGKEFSSRYQCEFIDNYSELLQRKDIDAIALTTPSGTHTELGIAAANAGKHVLCEKPLDVTLDKIDNLVNSCDRQKVLLGAIFQSRFGEGAQRLKKAVQAGRFGRLTQCSAFIPWFRSEAYYKSGGWRGTWALDGGGALMNQGIHAIDLLVWLAGDVESVSAKCDTRIHKSIEVEDNAAAWLRFKNGAIGVIQGSTCCFPGLSKRVEIMGESGTVVLEDDTPKVWEFEQALAEDEQIRNAKASIGGGASDPKAISVEGHIRQYNDFSNAIIEKRKPLIEGRDARRAVELILAIYESSKTGSVIKL